MFPIVKILAQHLVVLLVVTGMTKNKKHGKSLVCYKKSIE